MIYVYEREMYIPFQFSDAAGIVFFGHVYSIAHEVYELFIQDKMKIKWNDWFNNPEWIVPIKKCEAEYFAPLISGQKYLVKMHLSQITSSSISLAYSFEKDKKEHCLVEIVHVFCSRTKKTKQPIPSEINEALQKLMFS